MSKTLGYSAHHFASIKLKLKSNKNGDYFDKPVSSRFNTSEHVRPLRRLITALLVNMFSFSCWGTSAHFLFLEHMLIFLLWNMTILLLGNICSFSYWGTYAHFLGVCVCGGGGGGGGIRSFSFCGTYSHFVVDEYMLIFLLGNIC